MIMMILYMITREKFMQSLNRLTSENGWTDSRIRALQCSHIREKPRDMCTNKARDYVFGVSSFPV